MESFGPIGYSETTTKDLSEKTSEEKNRKNFSPHVSSDNRIAPTGLELIRLSLGEIVDWLLLFGGIRKSEAQPGRNIVIRELYAAGESLSNIGRAFGLSPQRIHQIVHMKS